MKTITRSVLVFLALAMAASAQSEFTPIDNRFAVKTFSDGTFTVGIYEDREGVMPVIRGRGQLGDSAQVTIIYRKTTTIGGKPVELILSRSVMCPVMDGADGGCDYANGIRLSDVAWVRVKFFKTLDEREIGRPKEDKKK